MRSATGATTTFTSALACASTAARSPPRLPMARIKSCTAADDTEPRSATAEAKPLPSADPELPKTNDGFEMRTTPPMDSSIAKTPRASIFSPRMKKPITAAHAGEEKRMAAASPSGKAPKAYVAQAKPRAPKPQRMPTRVLIPALGTGDAPSMRRATTMPDHLTKPVSQATSSECSSRAATLQKTETMEKKKPERKTMPNPSATWRPSSAAAAATASISSAPSSSAADRGGASTSSRPSSSSCRSDRTALYPVCF
mmetsp:Transcript_15713/g.52951  ORF Transcript_15713/g.52951 Transcript_15713/m.52951 type:complete len:255 (-) Transcript_15713:112-876(-)